MLLLMYKSFPGQMVSIGWVADSERCTPIDMLIPENGDRSAVATTLSYATTNNLIESMQQLSGLDLYPTESLELHLSG